MSGGLLDVVAKSTDQRPGGLRLTAGDSHEFAVHWSETASRVAVFLRRLGASHELADDLVQEVAVRLLRTAPDLNDEKDLLKWSYVVARNLYVDHVRRPGPVAFDPSELPEAPAAVDVPRAVEARLALRQVGQLLRTMSESDRTSLLEPLHDELAASPLSKPERTRLAVRRHRARNRLQELIAASTAALGVLWAHVRRLGQAPVAVSAVLPLLALAVVPLLTPEDGQPGLAPRPVVDQPHEADLEAPAESRVPPDPQGEHVAPREEKAAPAGTTSDDVEVETPVPGLGARSGTTAHEDRELACVGIGIGVDDLCLDKPTPVVTGTPAYR